jgi:phage portal protein BeeE
VSLFFRSQPEQRAMSTDWIAGTGFEGSQTKSGVAVTTTRAMQHGAMWSSANLLASIVSGLPVDVFRGTGTSKQEVSPLPRFVATPSLIVDRDDWIYQSMMSMLLRGNATGYTMERDALQRPLAA